MSRARDYLQLPQFAPKYLSRGVASHIGSRHVGQTLGQSAARKSAGVGIGRNSPVTSFPSNHQFEQAVRNATMPNTRGASTLHTADQFCSWGLKGNQRAFQNLIRARPDPSTWTLTDLSAHNIEFFITKDVKMVQGAREATVYGLYTNTPGAQLVNHDALAELGVASLQDAIDPSHANWRTVSKSVKYEILDAKNGEMLVKNAGKVTKVIKYGLLLVSVVVETVFFALEWERATNKIVHVADYAAQVGLIVGGFCACKAASAALITAGCSGLVAGLGTLGVGLVFAAAGIGLKLLFGWIQGQFKKAPERYHFTLDFYEMLPLYQKDHVFLDTSVLFDKAQLTIGDKVLDESSLFVRSAFFGA